jgi:hypothetical protein
MATSVVKTQAKVTELSNVVYKAVSHYIIRRRSMVTELEVPQTGGFVYIPPGLI